MSAARLTLPLVALLSAVALSACGAGGGEDVAVVAGRSVTLAQLTRWMKLLAPRHAIPAGANLRRALERRTLAFLIYSDWLAGEAAAQGAPVREAQIEHALREREAGYQGGRREFTESLHAIGYTLADVKLDIADELATRTLEHRAAASEATVTPADVTAYYHSHIAHYQHAETRWFHIFENLPRQTALEYRSELERGRRQLADGSLYESWERPDLRTARPVLKAIFTVRPHTISRLVDLHGYYFIVYVTTVRAPYTEALAHVRRGIAAKLRSELHRRTLARFVRQWRARWTARTSCSPGHIMQKCRQYRGARASEDPLSLT